MIRIFLICGPAWIRFDKSITSIEKKIETIESKLDENSVRLAQFGERIGNNRNYIERNEVESKKSDDLIHAKINKTKAESIAESVRISKN